MKEPWDLDAPPLALVPVLALGAAVYRAGLSLRRAAYAAGLTRIETAGVPVISVGNLTAGGNGKTPLVIALVERLAARGRTPAIVTRGYGAPDPPRDGPLSVGPATSWRQAGDEPVLVQRRTGATVVVAPDRARGVEAAIAAGADVVVLDDGFQHWRLARALDVVLIDARRPWSNGHVLPWGRLREPRAALGRAGLVVAHRGDASSPAPMGALAADVEIAIAPRGLIDHVTGRALAIDALRGARIGAAAAIGRPSRFLATLAALGAEVVATELAADHAALDDARIAALHARTGRVVVTEKDAVRLPSDAPVEVLSIGVVVLAGEAALDAAIDRALAEDR